MAAENILSWYDDQEKEVELTASIKQNSYTDEKDEMQISNFFVRKFVRKNRIENIHNSVAVCRMKCG